MENELTIPITYALIKHSVGWKRFCEVTGYNHYNIKEYGEPEPSRLYDVTETEAKELGFIK
jgi:hypothetical protein